jgi:serine/threonine protein kinase
MSNLNSIGENIRRLLNNQQRQQKQQRQQLHVSETTENRRFKKTNMHVQIPKYIYIDNVEYELNKNIGGHIFFYGNDYVMKVNKFSSMIIKEITIYEKLKKNLDQKCKNNIINYIGSGDLECTSCLPETFKFLICTKGSFDMFEYILNEVEPIGGFGVFTMIEILKIMRQIAYGIQCIHNSNIVYVDLKFENILIDNKNPKKPIIKIFDFDGSHNNNNNIKRITYSSTTMSPELKRYNHERNKGNLDNITYPTDIWSIGIMFVQIMNAFSIFPIDEYLNADDDTDEKIFKSVFEKHTDGGYYFQQINSMEKFKYINKEENKKLWNLTKLLVKRMIRLNPKKRITIDSVIKGIDYILKIKYLDTNTIERIINIFPTYENI